MKKHAVRSHIAFLVPLLLASSWLAQAQQRPRSRPVFDNFSFEGGVKIVQEPPARPARADLPAQVVRKSVCQQLNDKWQNVYAPALKATAASRAEFACPSVTSRLTQALDQLEAMKFEGPSPDFMTDITSRIASLEVIPDAAATAKDPYADAHRYSRHVRIYPAVRNLEFVELISTLYHEATHLRAEDPDHVSCGGVESGCDPSFTGSWSGGAFNFEYQFFAKVNESQAIDRVSRDVARALAKSYLAGRFARISSAKVRQESEKLDAAGR